LPVHLYLHDDTLLIFPRSSPIVEFKVAAYFRAALLEIVFRTPALPLDLFQEGAVTYKDGGEANVTPGMSPIHKFMTAKMTVSTQFYNCGSQRQ
jgi:hypothetical protein